MKASAHCYIYIYVGYRYFDTFQKPVQYPFGHGLSYTSFLWETETFKADAEGVSVTATVKNVGERSGKEVLQLYVGAPDIYSQEQTYFLKHFPAFFSHLHSPPERSRKTVRNQILPCRRTVPEENEDSTVYSEIDHGPYMH